MRPCPAPLFALVAATLFSTACASQGQEAEAVEEVRAIQVATETARPGVIADTVKLVGNIAPYRRVILSAETGGTVKEVAVELGDPVREGQVLARLDARSSTARLTQAKAQLQQAESARQLAQIDFERSERLHEQGASSTLEYQRAEAQWLSAQASVEAAEAGLQLAERSLEQCSFVAPFPGRIAARHLEKGALVRPGAPALELVDTSRVRVQAGVEAATVRNLSVGQEARVLVSDRPGEEPRFEIPGRVEHIGPHADTRTRTFPIEILAENQDGALLPGSLVRIEVVLRERDGAVLIPDLAVAAGPPATVFVLKGDMAHLRRIQLGAVDGEDREVLGGLEPGEEVVTLGRQHLSEGAQVKRYSMTALDGRRDHSTDQPDEG